MKRLIVIFLLFYISIFLYLSSAHAQMEKKYSEDGYNLSMFFLDDQYGWVGGSPIVRTKDGGENWEIVSPKVHKQYVNDLIFLSQNIGYYRELIPGGSAYYEGAWDGALYKTKDGGESWRKITTLPDSITAFTFFDENVGWACQRNGLRNSVVMKTINSGESWEKIWETKQEGLNVQLFDILAVSSDSFWIIQGENDVMGYKYTTKIILVESDGEHEIIKSEWYKLGSRGFGRFADASSADLLFIRGLYDGFVVASTPGFIRYNATTDETTFFLDLPPVWDIETSDHYTYYFHFHKHPYYENNDCIFYSQDKGSTLNLFFVIPPVPNDPDAIYKTFSVINENTLFFATLSGNIYKYTNNTVKVSGDLSLPSFLELYPPSPNPFNPSTIIKFKLYERSDVELIVYNSIGMNVISLIDKVQLNKGLHEVVFDGTGLANGVYYYMCKTQKAFEVGKMVLMK